MSLPALAMGLGGICIMEKMTQYSEFGCIFLHNYAFKISHFLHKPNYIVNVEGSSIVLHIECLGGMFLCEIFLKSGTINLMSFSEYYDIISS